VTPVWLIAGMLAVSAVQSGSLVCRATDQTGHAELAAAMQARDVDRLPPPAANASYISAGEVLRRQRAGERLHLVDPRPRGAATRFRIEQALSLTAVRVKAHTHWKHELIVLVGSGAAYRALEGMQQALQEDGFTDVQILDGGARLWQSEVERRRPDATDLMVEAGEVDLAADAARWIIVDMTEQARALPSKLRRVPVSAESAGAAARAAAVSIPPSQRRVNVLVVADDDALAAAVTQLLAEQVRANVYALQGGWDAYVLRQRWLQQLHAGIKADDAPTPGSACW
jgi:rhodanese-related sulfurtransferase